MVRNERSRTEFVPPEHTNDERAHPECLTGEWNSLFIFSHLNSAIVYVVFPELFFNLMRCFESARISVTICMRSPAYFILFDTLPPTPSIGQG
jgi:hypothetical protein